MTHPVLPSVAVLVQAPGKVGARQMGGIMPLHFGKVFGVIALLTVAAFVLWLLWGALFEGEEADQEHPAFLPSVTVPAVQLAAAD
jgi:uncharacterized membrane protein